MPKIVIIGEGGQLAQSLRRLHWPAGSELSFHGRRSLGDGGGPDHLSDLLRAEEAHLVLNAAAFTGVDRAEADRAAAHALNAALPAALASACRERDIPLVHISTDYVFDGARRQPYAETAAPNPLNVYGATKLAGDRAVDSAAPRRWAILRTSWLVSELGDTFPVKILRRAQAGEALRVVDDQQGCPTAASDLARAMQQVGLLLLDEDKAAGGLFNFCGSTAMTWHGFAERLLDAAQAAGLKRTPLQAIKSAELKAAARRPAYSILSCALIRERCGITHAEIDSEIERMVRSILVRP
ncbi:MAG TPA: dTDP-4-dehydrorhamnose reductase [Dongiaceae bacterium]|nr:dTDP-4-dehydrorhamnose reductase [Dongiaceae bacterium]